MALQKKLNDDLLECLEHILLGHHDPPEFGAIVRPATPEAFFVVMADNLDVTMGMVKQLPKTTPTTNVFSDKHFGLDSRILVEKITHKQCGNHGKNFSMVALPCVHSQAMELSPSKSRARDYLTQILSCKHQNRRFLHASIH
jgi:hypothetical protein